MVIGKCVRSDPHEAQAEQLSAIRILCEREYRAAEACGISQYHTGKVITCIIRACQTRVRCGSPDQSSQPSLYVLKDVNPWKEWAGSDTQLAEAG